jgi:hypothetical protein
LFHLRAWRILVLVVARSRRSRIIMVRIMFKIVSRLEIGIMVTRVLTTEDEVQVLIFALTNRANTIV